MSTNPENNKSQSALREEAVLAFWEKEKIFQKSVEKNAGAKEFVFYEGPPTANAKPALHHLEARAFKDVIPRYKTMQGFHVRRRAGWDTHGLPVELQIEKKLGFKSKKDIESYGIAEFNKACKESVFEYIGEWEKFTDRIGYWVDKKSAYYTFDPKYMESLWNIIARVNERGLLYKDYKVVPWCPRCGTALASHELAQGYQMDKDLSVYAKFKIMGFPDAYFLAWTTTPWTLPGNVALAVGADIEYVEIKVTKKLPLVTAPLGASSPVGNKIEKEIYVLAKSRFFELEKDFEKEFSKYEIIATHKGSEMVGMAYEPLYDFIKEKKVAGIENAFKVYTADFVTTEEGTGMVHTAVMYGQDDFELGNKIGLPKYHLVDEAGHFIHGTGFLEGKFVKDETTAVDIIKDLAHRGLLYKKEKHEHSYPHCWRCKTPLIYYARDSWYIGMSKLRDDLIAENKKIHWEPSHIQDGRFGEWLREVKDWAISRERYWGTPLPIWQTHSTSSGQVTAGEKIVVGSVEELKKYVKKSGNTYYVARHGEAMSNVKMLLNAKFDPENKLTENGIAMVKKNAGELSGVHFDMIFSSPMPRTKQTAELIADTLGYDKSKIIFDDRLWEFNIGTLEGKTIEDHHAYMRSLSDYFTAPLPHGESNQDLYKRMGGFIYDIEKKYVGKKILIVTHGDPIMALFILSGGFTGARLQEHEKSFKYYDKGEIRKLNFVPLPHNENYELDLHKPYIDAVEFLDDSGAPMTRVKEVMDVWFDSGAMPFAQEHYPFDKNAGFQPKKGFLRTQHGYPADFISEAIDQTRGWFYTLLAVGTLMECGTPFKNAICLGHLLDKDGKKMSKSIGNIVEPWAQIEKYGADTLRLWMYSVNQPGDSKNYDEKTVLELHRQIFGLLYNVLAFYDLYRTADSEQGMADSKNVLDQWIVARLNQLIQLATESLDNYKTMEPVRALRDFIDDLSTWYLRRSRERIKDGDVDAKNTLYYVLKTLAKVMAPFAPFAGEDVWQKLKNGNDVESVHLAEWPKVSEVDERLMEDMRQVRQIVSYGLEERQKQGIKVRQPLSSLSARQYTFIVSNNKNDYLEIIMEELNVKKIDFLLEGDKPENQKVFLDTNITPELKAEGDYRELVRAIQDLRKQKGLTPSDTISLTIDTYEAGKTLVKKFESELKKAVLASHINFDANGGERIMVDEIAFVISVGK